MPDVAIIGGGISGLSAAYYLAQAGLPSTIFEPAPRLGGVIQTESVDGCLVEAGPDSFVAQKPWALQLIRELGLENEVIGSNDHLRKTYILRRGRLVPMPDGLYLMVPTALWPLATSRLLGFGAKCRMGLELLRRPRAAPAPDRSVAEFIRDHYGQETVDYLAEPLLAGIYGGDAASLSIHSVLPRFLEFEQRYGSLTRGVLANRQAGKTGSLFLSLQGGMQRLVEALEIAVAGSASVARGAVERLETSPNGYRLWSNGASVEAGQVVVATPAHVAGLLLQGLDASLADLLGDIRYHSSITVALGYDRSAFRRPLNGFGFLVPRVERRLVAACTWVGTKFPHRVAADRVLLRAFIAAGSDESLLARPDDDLLRSVSYELAHLMGVTEAPRFARVHRWRRAMAQYEVGHASRLEQIQERLARFRGLHLAGNGYFGIGVPDCVRSGQLAAQAIASQASDAAHHQR